jgi:Spy/CpxP family protein refolding chaperone
MNKKIWLSALMAGALAGSALTVFAQDAPPPAGDNGGQTSGDNNGPQGGNGHGRPGMGPGGPQGGMVMNPDKLKDKLGLTDDQVTQMKDLFRTQMAAGKTIQDQMKLDIDTLQQKVDAKASVAELQKSLDALAADRKAMQASRENMETQVNKILTTVQQAKLILGMQNRGGQFMQRLMNRRKMNQGNSSPDAGGDSSNAPGAN